jgi:hypothetical protein
LNKPSFCYYFRHYCIYYRKYLHVFSVPFCTPPDRLAFRLFPFSKLVARAPLACGKDLKQPPSLTHHITFFFSSHAPPLPKLPLRLPALVGASPPLLAFVASETLNYSLTSSSICDTRDQAQFSLSNFIFRKTFLIFQPQFFCHLLLLLAFKSPIDSKRIVTTRID